MFATASKVTLTVAVAVAAPLVAVTTAVPGAVAVTRPVLEIAATPQHCTDHVAWVLSTGAPCAVVPESVNRTVSPTCIATTLGRTPKDAVVVGAESWQPDIATAAVQNAASA
jgi:hypothetical protein